MMGPSCTMGYMMIPRIHPLDTRTINQIAAGEVIDRPVSIVKELIENAMDANATHIQVTLLKGGITSISVTDNGHGIPKEDLPLAIQDHATSKITTLADVLLTNTMGFRGEALASIREVAHLTIVSRTDVDPTGWKITGTGGAWSDVTPLAHPRGTTVMVTDLFYNTPVRHRFLKSATSELNGVMELVRSFALCHPNIVFELTHDQHLILSTARRSIPDLIHEWWGADLANAMIPIQASSSPIQVTGWVTQPTVTLQHRSKIITTINRRLIKSPTMLKAISQAYADVIPSGRFPMAIVMIDMPHHEVDINVHPQKWDIKFAKPAHLFEAITHGIRATLAPLTIPPYHDSHPDSAPSPSSIPSDWGRLSHLMSPTPPSFDTTIQPSLPYPMVPLSAPVWQVLDTYLLVQVPDGVWVIDQHAAHERLLYEQLKSQNSPDTQPLLIPDVVPWPIHAGEVLDAVEWLTLLGFDISHFGQTDLLVRAIPITLSGPTSLSTILAFAEEIGHIPDIQSTRLSHDKDRLQRMACRAAIKAGKRMSHTETHQLIQDLLSSPTPLTCPHGRPVAIFWGKSVFEKSFHRI